MTRKTMSMRKHSRDSETLPVCPACGRPECLCRPRFFAGQLLTEEDLNRLDRYIREKNKLHNRYLHGWGVVCGLEAYCDDCQSTSVLVEPGYALSPCGEDVIVCDKHPVDMSELIRQCRQVDEVECDPFRPPAREECDEDTEKWVLAICYQERPTRGVTALRTGVSKSCGCRSGGDGVCGCAAKNSDTCGDSRTSSGVPRIAAQCENTVVCESYSFTAYRTDSSELDPSDSRFGGALTERLNSCLEPYVKLYQDLAALTNEELTLDEKVERFRAIKRRLRTILSTQGLQDCLLLKRLAEICPSEVRATPARPSLLENEIDEGLGQMAEIWARGLLECICSALLPPCPVTVEHNCIPLAAVTVRKEDCRVLRVCNWTVERKFATTWPSLQYWLSPLPLVSILRDVIEEACCRGFGIFDNEERADSDRRFGVGAGSRVSASASARFSLKYQDLAQLAKDAAAGQATTLDPKSLFRKAGGFRVEDPPLDLKRFERDNFAQFLFLSLIAGPISKAVSARRGGDMKNAEEQDSNKATENRERRKTSASADSETMGIQEELAALEAKLEQLRARLGREPNDSE